MTYPFLGIGIPEGDEVLFSGFMVKQGVKKKESAVPVIEKW